MGDGMNRIVGNKWGEGPPSGKASDFIHHLPEFLEPGGAPPRVVLWCRVTNRRQKANLPKQIEMAGAELRQLGLEPIAVKAHVCSSVAFARSLPDELWEAATVALEADAILVARSVDRFVRHSHWSKHRQDQEPATCDLRELRLWTRHVTLATIRHPDTPLRDINKLRKQEGHARGNKGGRPKSKERPKDRRRRNLPKIHWLHAVGMTNREIARTLEMPESTARRYVNSIRWRIRQVAHDED